MRIQHACVTGGAGFIGSKLVRRLLENGVAVTVLDNLSTGRLENLPAGVRFIHGDLLDAKLAAEAIAGCDSLFHLAARVAIRSSFEFVVEDTLANAGGTASILRAAAMSGGIRRVVSTSSMAVYSDAPTSAPITEEHPTKPISPYGISKLAAEQLTHSLCKTAGMESAVLRLFNTYGTGQAFSPYVGVVTIFANKLGAGQETIIFGDGQQARDFVHVDDVVSAFLAAMDATVSGETFNVGTGRATTVNRVFETLANHMGQQVSPRHVEAAPGELRFSVANIDKARQLLGYEPKHVFESSIGLVVDEILKSKKET